MTFYETEIRRIRNRCYANDKQLATVIAVRNFIEASFAEELNLDLLSRIHFTSKYHLLRLFKRYYGLTPRQYQINLRIAKAKAQLKNGRSVTETCFAVGFASPGSFSTLFRAKTGKSPRQFRKEQLSRST